MTEHHSIHLQTQQVVGAFHRCVPVSIPEHRSIHLQTELDVVRATDMTQYRLRSTTVFIYRRSWM